MGERLERIKSDWYNEDCIDNKDVDWLIEQAERVQNLSIEHENGLLQYQLVKENNNILLAENQILREQLVQQQKAGFWGRTAGKLSTENRKLREALKNLIDVLDNNLPRNLYHIDRTKAQQALESDSK